MISIKNINDHNLIIYTILLTLYFLLYFMVNLNIESDLDTETENKKKSITYISLIDFFYFIVITIFFVYYYKKDMVQKMTDKYKFITIAFITIASFVISYFNVEIFNIENKSSTINYIYIVMSLILYGILATLFIFNLYYNSNSVYNVEFLLSLLIIILFAINSIISTTNSIKNIYYRLKNDNFSILTVNCFKKTNFNEGFFANASENTLAPTNSQINDISNKYGSTYLKTTGNVPIAFFNKKTNSYQDLTLADFYYPGSYYSYLADSPLNGTPKLESLKIILSKFKSRIVHLDIFSSDDTDEFSPKAYPVVRCKNMNPNGVPLRLDECFGLINKWAWIVGHPDNKSYPFFLYLKLNFNVNNTKICEKIYHHLIKSFSKYFVDKKYSFSGRNNLLPISHAKMKECLGKIVIVTDIYPTNSVLDELINASSSDINKNFNMNLYKESYVNFDKIGLSQDYDKTTLINSCKTNINFFYAEPNEKYKNNNQEKAGLFNPSFQDCAQYGAQSTLMYMFLPDENLNKWMMYFQNKNNMDPVLKDEILRLVDNNTPVVKKEDPIIGLQKPQKYCLIPGMLSTEKSNLSDSLSNNSC